MKIRLAFISGLLAGAVCVGPWALGYKPFPGNVVDQRTRQIQERVEEIYSSGNFDRALSIYEKDLAPMGDKYAQYMVGYMHLQAEGAAVSKVEALSWFRLAAERREPLFIEVRDSLIADSSVEEIRESDARFLELWKSIGDRKLLLELIRHDLDTLRSQTGIRIPGSSSSSPGMSLKPSGVRLDPNYYADIRTRLKERITYLDARVDVVDIVLTEEINKARKMEATFREELAAMGNR